MTSLGNKEIFSRNLKRLMNENNIDRNTLCKNLNFRYSTVSEWISAKKYPRIDKIEMLANYFNVKKSDLIEDRIPAESNAELLPINEIRMIPIFETVSAGFGAYASSDIVDYMPLFIESDYEAKDTLCIKVSGNSMYPKIEDGDIVQVHKQDIVDSGQIAVVMIDNENGFVKKIELGSDYIELISINPEYSPKRFEKEEMNRVNIVGLVKKIIKEC
jgi:repressor LexA